MPTDFPGWYMSVQEREILALWLVQFRGYEIILEAKLEELSRVGITYDPARRRLKFAQHSVDAPVHPRQHFIDILERGHLRGDIAGGAWRGVDVLDLAEALSTLAGFTVPVLPHVTSKIDRFQFIVSVLRGEPWSPRTIDPTQGGLRA